MKLIDYQKIITQILQDSFDERESNNLFKYTVEEYYNNKYNNIKNYIITDDETEDLNIIFEKLSNHYPIQYLFNEAYFYDLKIYVDENVLIPRPETEELVHLILKENEIVHAKVLDIGTGSGCIPIALKNNRKNWDITSIDVSDKAIEIAKNNAKIYDTAICFLQADVLDLKLQFSDLDIIVSNPPYISVNQKSLMSQSTVLHEPALALYVSDDNPLIFYKCIFDIAIAIDSLKIGGKIYLEINEFFSQELKTLADSYNFDSVLFIDDMYGKKRILKIIK